MPKFVMSDARAFTDYNPNCDLNNIIQKKYNVNNASYRAFLQQNAEKLIKDSFKQEEKACANCPVCKEAVEYKP
jgi:hypothetical protein